MSPIILSQTIAAPVDRVFALAADIPNVPTFIPHILRVEMLAKPTPTQVGTRWRETRKMMGKEAAVELEFAEFVPPSRSMITCSVANCRYDTCFEFTPTSSGGTSLTMTARIFPRGPIAWLLATLTKSAMRSGMRQDMLCLKQAAEMGR
jgi:uncharacterized protein YndB with AHSA1/START domain